MNKLQVNGCILAILLLVSSFTNNALASQEDAQKFVEKVSRDALAIITSGSGDKQKEDKLIQLFTISVDTKWIARFAMGKYWREATEEQRTKYVEAHRKFLLNSYVPKFKEYNNQQIKVIKANADGENEYTVETQIISGDGTAININYKIRNESGKYMIFDVIAEGVSLITTQRADFGSVLSRSGINELIAMLEKKV